MHYRTVKSSDLRNFGNTRGVSSQAFEFADRSFP